MVELICIVSIFTRFVGLPAVFAGYGMPQAFDSMIERTEILMQTTW